MTWQTIVVAIIVGAIFTAIIVKGIINKKKGKSSCACGSCGGCARELTLTQEEIDQELKEQAQQPLQEQSL